MTRRPTRAQAERIDHIRKDAPNAKIQAPAHDGTMRVTETTPKKVHHLTLDLDGEFS